MTEMSIDDARRWGEAIDQCASSIWLTGPDGVELVNDAYLKGAKRTADEVVGDFWTARTNPDDAANYIRLRDEAWAEKRPFLYQARYQGGDGTWVRVTAICTPRLDAEGNVIGSIGVSCTEPLDD